MQISNSANTSFSGLGISGKVKAAALPRLSSFVENPKNWDRISKLEKDYNTDVMLSSCANVVSFKNKSCGFLMKFGMPKYRISDFENHFDKIVVACDKAVKRAEDFKAEYYRRFDHNI